MVTMPSQAKRCHFIIKEKDCTRQIGVGKESGLQEEEGLAARTTLGLVGTSPRQ